MRRLLEHIHRDAPRTVTDYPVVDTIVGDNGSATLVLLDSCKHRSTHILSNAIGCFGEIQLTR